MIGLLMAKLDHDLIKVGLLLLGLMFYSGVMIYLIQLDKNNVLYLKNLSKLNIKSGIFL